MDLKVIKQIIDLMKRSGLTEFEIEEKDFKLRIGRQGEVVQTFPGVLPSYAPMAAAPAPAAAVPAAVAEKPADAGRIIKSPMVGTFYSAPSPDSPAYVGVGDAVKVDAVVCIIEAMKVMNEIKAEIAGTVTEILVANGESVEFGQPLFRLK